MSPHIRSRDARTDRSSAPVRWLATAVVTLTASAGVLVGGSLPAAAANTNVNGVCETSEACNYRNGGGGAFNAAFGLWDYEGTDHDFRNNTYVGGYHGALDNQGSSFWMRGQRCSADFSNGYGDPDDDSEHIIGSPGFSTDVSGTGFDNSASQLTWLC